MTKTAYVFPGQGAQSVGMGQESFNEDPEIKKIYLQADEIFAEFHKNNSLSVKSISEISFNGPEELLTKTIYTQPAILTLSIALAQKLKQEIKSGTISAPNFVAGHSLGEFSALFMADVLSLEDVLKLVCKRAELMENAPSGAMSAIVGCDENQLNELLKGQEGVSVANYNAPDQIVITGTKTGVENFNNKMTALATEQNLKVRVIPLNVGGAFHSPLMQSASDEFSRLIDQCDFRNPNIPIIQNTVAVPVLDAQSIKENLKKQMCGSVRWTETVKFLISNPDKVEEVWEIGPSKVLVGLIKKQERRFNVKNISSSSEMNAILNPQALAS
jgi:[acyl-carrier-protein] S-malonyltransferase